MNSAVAAFMIILLALSNSSATIAAGEAVIRIGDFWAVPSYVETDLRSLRENVSIHLTFSNSGNESGTVNIKISEGSILIASSNVTVEANSTSVVNFTWSLTGEGKHNFTAVISGDAAASPASMETGCTLKYVPMKQPSPWYTIPCAFLFIIVPFVAIFLFFRRLGKGKMPKKTAGDGTEEKAAGRRQEGTTKTDGQQAERQKGTDDAMRAVGNRDRRVVVPCCLLPCCLLPLTYFL